MSTRGVQNISLGLFLLSFSIALILTSFFRIGLECTNKTVNQLSLIGSRKAVAVISVDDLSPQEAPDILISARILCTYVTFSRH